MTGAAGGRTGGWRLVLLAAGLALPTLAASQAPARAPAQRADAGRAAVIVHASNPITSISAADLRRILLGEDTRWPDQGGRITILLLGPGTEDRRVVLRNLLKMSDGDFVRHWLGLVFQGEATSGPKVLRSAASLVRTVAALPAAIGIVGAEELPPSDAGVKALEVDGKPLHDDAYPFIR
jgi:ABC-type phosphate transport system substrate-binding protein